MIHPPMRSGAEHASVVAVLRTRKKEPLHPKRPTGSNPAVAPPTTHKSKLKNTQGAAEGVK